MESVQSSIDLTFRCGSCGHSATLGTINQIRRKYGDEHPADAVDIGTIASSDKVVCIKCGNKMCAICGKEIEKTADEKQTWLRRLKQKFITTLRKDPIIRQYGINPEAIWEVLDDKMVFELPSVYQYQKVNQTAANG
jgi:hypothetical protein